MAKKAIDISGQVFGLLTASHISNKKPSGEKLWLCKCECGGEKEVTSSHLQTGKVKSCGCMQNPVGVNNPTWKGYKLIGSAFWGGYERGAKARNIEFNITMEEAWELYEAQDGKCFYTGQPIEFSANSRKARHGSASLDRRDSSKGYTKDNCVWTNKDINRFKNKYSEEEFIMMCEQVTSYFKPTGCV